MELTRLSIHDDTLVRYTLRSANRSADVDRYSLARILFQHPPRALKRRRPRLLGRKSERGTITSARTSYLVLRSGLLAAYCAFSTITTGTERRSKDSPNPNWLRIAVRMLSGSGIAALSSSSRLDISHPRRIS
jgi:hypothetical protein